MKALGVAYAVVSPLMILIVVTAPVMVPTLFGEKWRASVPPTQALALAGIITLGAMLDHGLFYGLGRPGSWLRYSIVVDTATVATTAIAVRWDLRGVAIGFVIVAVLATVARWVLVARLLGLPQRVVARPFFTILGPTAITVVLGGLLFRSLSGSHAPWVVLVVAGGATVIVYLVLLRLLAQKVIRDALGILPVPQRYADRVARLLLLSHLT